MYCAGRMVGHSRRVAPLLLWYAALQENARRGSAAALSRAHQLDARSASLTS